MSAFLLVQIKKATLKILLQDKLFHCPGHPLDWHCSRVILVSTIQVTSVWWGQAAVGSDAPRNRLGLFLPGVLNIRSRFPSSYLKSSDSLASETVWFRIIWIIKVAVKQMVLEVGGSLGKEIWFTSTTVVQVCMSQVLRSWQQPIPQRFYCARPSFAMCCY